MNTEPGKHGSPELEKMLAEALAAGGRADEAHFEFDDLTNLADARRVHGEAWEMPPHLSGCALCLEAFQVILEGLTKPSATTLKRFDDVRKNETDSKRAGPKIIPFQFPWKTALKIAAAVVLVFGAFGLLNQFGSRTPAHVSAGAVTLPDGKLLPLGAVIPEGVTVTATEPMSVSLADGSTVELAKDSRASFRESTGGNTTVALAGGQVTAAVAKQKSGHEFTVKTPLGDVVVVGTKFSVTCQAEDVVVYQNTEGAAATQHHDVVRAMRVVVTEGIVRVKHQGQQAFVHPNETAVLRENEPGIDVAGSK